MSATITWNCQDDDSSCDNCLLLDGQEFTPDTIPGWPGDGSFGNDILCEGGPRCFPADTQIQAVDIEGTYKRWYEGELIEIITADGHTLSGTPNHPVLTCRGWIALGELNEGDHLIGGTLGETSTVDPHITTVPTCIAEVVDSFNDVDSSMRHPVLSMDFHGDGVGSSEVEIVRTHGQLRNSFDTTVAQPLREFHLSGADMGKTALSCLRHADVIDVGARLTSHSVVSLSGDGLTLLGSERSHSSTHLLGGDESPGCLSFGGGSSSVLESGRGIEESLGFSRGSNVSSVFLDNSLDESDGTSNLIGESLSALTLEISLDKVLFIHRRTFAGHVYNLETASGWYIAGGILVHNCRCWLTYNDDSGNTAVGTSDLGTQWNLGNLSGVLGPQGQIAAWTDATQSFIDQLPDVIQPNQVYSAQARAQMRLQVRQQIAQQLGIHPADVSASAVAAQVPAIYKSMQPTMRIVYEALSENYPDTSIEWIDQMNWGYVAAVPIEDISVTGPSSESDAKSIRKKVKKIEKGKPVKPLILIDPGDGGLLQVADGHHRCAAALEADLKSVPAYVGKVHTDDDWRREVMDMQMVRAKKMHGTMGGTIEVIEPQDTLNGEPDFEESGTGETSESYMPGGHMVVDPSDDPVAHHKNFSLSSPLATGFAPFDLSGPDITIKFAGLMVQALDSGRVLMLQRSLGPDDPAAGQWEIPGGHLEDGEQPLEAAMREWSEEVGSVVPPLKIVGRWTCHNGYQGFLGLCTSESDIDIHSREVVNPDDPDGDNAEAVAWFYPADLVSMPGVRQATRDNTPWSRIVAKVAA